MPIPDFYECMIYEQLEPFGDLRGDLQAGIIAATVANFSGRAKRALDPIDYMPFAAERPTQKPTDGQTPEEMHANFLACLHAAELKKSLS